VLQSRTIDQVKEAGSLNFNTFMGFHADHAYAAFHPSDVRSQGVWEPDMTLPDDLVRLGAWSRIMAGANMLHPSVAIFFVVGAPVDTAGYEAAATEIKAHCTSLPVYLAAAAKWHTRVTVGEAGTFLEKEDYFGNVLAAVRKANTFGDLVKDIKNEGHGVREHEFRVAATMLKLAADFYPAVLDVHQAMLKEFRDWRSSKSDRRKPQAFWAEAASAAEAARRAATLVLCGYLFFPDSAGAMGVSDVFQLCGEGLRYGEFGVATFEHGFQHGALTVKNNLEAGVVGFKVAGHAARTLKTVHRIILLDAVKTHLGPDARWAMPDEVPVDRPASEVYVVTRRAEKKLELEHVTTGDKRVVQLAVHPCAMSTENSGTVVPVVFSPAGDLVFERYTRCTRGAVGAPLELHGAQLLREGDEVGASRLL
jgi:hypothetical protein